MFLDPFQILLNGLSSELHERNLHSLIHVCGNHIPAGEREKISSGWGVFSILRQRNLIGSEPEKMANLLRIIKELRPRRRDFVDKIKRHIEENYEEPELILKDFESSSEYTLPIRVISRSSTPIIDMPQEDCCRIRCCGLTCSFNPCCDGCCCCVILAILFSFLAIVAALAWYSSIPVVNKYLNDRDDLKHAGPYVISSLGILAVCNVIGVIYIRCCRPRDQLNYTVLPASHEIRSSRQASYAASDSSQACSCHSAAMGQRIERRRRECSFSSGQYTASSSLNSRASLRYPRLPDDVVPDGFPHDDNSEVFTREEEEVEGDLTEPAMEV